MSRDDELLSDYLLGEMEPGARERFERRLAQDAELQQRVARLAPAVEQLEALPGAAWDVVEERTASAGAAAAADGSVAAGHADAGGAGAAADGSVAAAGADADARTGADQRDGAGDRTRRARRPSRWRRLIGFDPPPRAWGLATAASVALLAAGVGIGVLLERGDGTAPPAVTTANAAPDVVLSPLESAPASARAEARMTGPDRMLLTISDLTPSPPGTYYEAWLLNDADDLVPVASFRVNAAGRAVVAVPLPAAAGRYQFLDVSVQRIDGGTEHSARSVLRGSLS